MPTPTLTESGLSTGTWTVDPSHSAVNFVARHLMVSKVRGHFGTFNGTVTVADDPLQSTLDATVEVGSLTTGDVRRDEHLRSNDFFDAERYPTMHLVSTNIEARGDNEFLLHTNLTIRGITKPVDFKLEFDGVSRDPWGGTRAGFTARADVNRKDWGLEWNMALETGGVLVSDKVTIELEVEAVKS